MVGRGYGGREVLFVQFVLQGSISTTLLLLLLHSTLIMSHSSHRNDFFQSSFVRSISSAFPR